MLELFKIEKLSKSTLWLTLAVIIFVIVISLTFYSIKTTKKPLPTINASEEPTITKPEEVRKENATILDRMLDIFSKEKNESKKDGEEEKNITEPKNITTTIIGPGIEVSEERVKSGKEVFVSIDVVEAFETNDFVEVEINTKETLSYDQIIEKIFRGINESEYKIQHHFSTSIEATISERAFEKIKNNENIFVIIKKVEIKKTLLDTSKVINFDIVNNLGYNGSGDRLYDLSDFPEPFIRSGCIKNTVFISGENFADVESLKNFLEPFSYFGIPTNVGCHDGSIALDTEYIVSERLNQINIISIGGPCANKITAQIMELPTTWPDCATGFSDGVGRIIQFNKWNKTQIVVAGYSAEDTKNAAEVIANYQSYSLSGFQREVIGKIGNLSVTLRESDSRGNKIDDKIYSSLKNPNQPSWVDNGDGTWNLLVACYENIDLNTCQMSLENYGQTQYKIGLNGFVLKADKNNIRFLAEDDHVLSIFAGPAPVKPHE